MGFVIPQTHLRSARVATAVWVALAMAIPASAQLDDAKIAVNNREYQRAVELLTPVMGADATVEHHLYLGIALANLQEHDRAESALRDGMAKFPEEPRLHETLAGVYLARGDSAEAQAALREALRLNPASDYAADLLGTIEMSGGDLRGALGQWNALGRPVVRQVLYNGNPEPAHWIQPAALAFSTDRMLTYAEWRTTEERLIATGVFTGAGVEIEPDATPGRYNVVVRGTPRQTTASSMAIDLLAGVPGSLTRLNLRNIGDSGVSLRSAFRWKTNRRRAWSALSVPLPVRGIPVVELGAEWRSERWDLEPNLDIASAGGSRFDVRSTALHAMVRHVPHYRIEAFGGFRYVNRYGRGGLLNADGAMNTAEIVAGSVVRLFDGANRSAVRATVSVARPWLSARSDFAQARFEMQNRIQLTERVSVDVDGTLALTRGTIPVERQFILGTSFGDDSVLLMRGHDATDGNHYGRSPVARNAAVVNGTLARRFVRVPTFNALGFSVLDIAGVVFLDYASTFRRPAGYRTESSIADAGVGIRFEGGRSALTFAYGKSLTDASRTISAHVVRRFW